MYVNVGLIGCPLSHTLSPTLHSYFFHKSGVNGGYCCFEIPSTEGIGTILETFKRYSFAGFNITVPYKTDIMKYCDELGDDASSAEAVNTVSFKDGKILGYNTDVFGFSKLLERAKVSVIGKNILLLGAGGAAKAVATYMNKNKPACLTVVNRTMEKAAQLANGCAFETCIEKDFSKLSGKSYDVVINSTSLGIRGEGFPSLNLGEVGAFVDLQYGGAVTPFLASAGKARVKVDGFDMLVYQGLKAFEIWTGKKIELDMELLNEIIRMKK